jgi:hypothetical protein
MSFPETSLRRSNPVLQKADASCTTTMKLESYRQLRQIFVLVRVSPADRAGRAARALFYPKHRTL